MQELLHFQISSPEKHENSERHLSYVGHRLEPLPWDHPRCEQFEDLCASISHLDLMKLFKKAKKLDIQASFAKKPIKNQWKFMVF